MYLEEMSSAIRIELQDLEAGSNIWETDEITRAINKTTSLMSRLLPKRNVVKGTITSDMIESDYLLDISSILDDYIKIERVEYNIDQSPPQFPTFDIIDKYLMFRTDVSLTADDEIRIIYLGRWTPPTLNTVGDYPTHLDNTVIIGSAGQALIFKSEQYTQDAISCIALAKSTLDDIGVVSGVTVLDIGSKITNAETALTAAIARFTAAVTEVAKMDTPLANAATAVGKVAAEVAAGKAYLETGDDLINTATRGDDVGETYGVYAQVQATLASGYSSEAERNITIANGWEARASREATIGNNYLNEAIQRLTVAARLIDKYQYDLVNYNQDISYYRAQVEKATSYGTTATQFLSIAGRYLADGQAKINEMLISLGLKVELTTQRALSEQRA